MDTAMAEQVRRFNRVVTQRIGALDDHYLSRDRPLGEARLLWEIGADGADTRSLRTRLGLDSGYLSRLLRALETAGLAEVRVSQQDGRVRTVQLTEAGRLERALLDRRSDELAESLLQPLADNQRARLVAAMHEVERLLTASLVDIGVADPADPRVQYCLREYASELTRRFPGGFDPARSISATDEELRPPAGLMVIATMHTAPIGCGAVKFHPGEPSEIKRMWVAGTARGLGIARRLLTELETHAAQSNPVIRLETNETLQEAIALYRSAGYREVDPFNDEPYAHHWFEKRCLDAELPKHPHPDQHDDLNSPDLRRARA
jgi:DNA-binding MarR family transcriptional regulator/GNAT superfamily N-acetyltransferase